MWLSFVYGYHGFNRAEDHLGCKVSGYQAFEGSLQGNMHGRFQPRRTFGPQLVRVLNSTLLLYDPEKANERERERECRGKLVGPVYYVRTPTYSDPVSAV